MEMVLDMKFNLFDVIEIEIDWKAVAFICIFLSVICVASIIS